LISTLVDFETIFGTGSVGPNMHNFSSQRDYKNDSGTGLSSWSAVGKVGFGGMTISDDMKNLYVVNLFDRKVYELPLDQPITSANVRSVSIPFNQDLLSAGNSINNPTGNIRPWAIKLYKGKLYVGMVSTGETLIGGDTFTDTNADGLWSNNPAEPYVDLDGNGRFDYVHTQNQLKAYVYELNPSSMVFNAQPILSLNLDDYNTGGNHPSNGGSYWNTWNNNPKYLQVC
jgi:hypothetical protein